MKLLIGFSSVLIVLLLVSSVTHACGWYLAYKDLTGKTSNIKAFDTAKECEADKANRIKDVQHTQSSPVSVSPPGFRPLTPEELTELREIAFSSFCTIYE